LKEWALSQYFALFRFFTYASMLFDSTNKSRDLIKAKVLKVIYSVRRF